MLNMRSWEKLTPVSLIFLFLRLYFKTKTQCRFGFQQIVKNVLLPVLFLALQ